MKAIDKVTKRTHAICPVLGGFQVCLVPDMDLENAELSHIHVFLNKDFYTRFDFIIELKGDTQ